MDHQDLIELLKGFRVLKPLNPFKSGVKYVRDASLAVNPYKGCPYKCMYCYIYGYLRASDVRNPSSKKLFKRRLRRDLKKYDQLNLPRYRVQISPSCEPLHPFLEKRYGNTLYALENLREQGFPVTVMTKNPSQLLKPEYLEALDKRSTRIEVSIPFLDSRFEPEASMPIGRIWTVSKLVKEGFNVFLKIEPVIPSYGGIAGQSKVEFETIVGEARKAGVHDVFAKCLLLPIGVCKIYPSFFKELKPYYKRHGYRSGVYYVLNYGTRIRLLKPLYDVCRRYDVRLWTYLNGLPISYTPKYNEFEQFAESKSFL